MSKSFDWNDHYIELLRKLWHQGKSGAEIARTFGHGCTRCAVIGKARRLSLDGRPSPIKHSPMPADKAPVKPLGFRWMEEQEGTLRRLWALNRSPVQIAEAIGGDITPSRVSLKAIGLNLPRRKVAVTVINFNNGRSLAAQLSAEVIRLARPRPAYEGQPLPMEHLDRKQCCFAVTPHQARRHLFCAAPTTPGSVYCAGHHLAAYRTAVPADIQEQAA